MAIEHSVPDEHLRHIGDITVSFALLETNVQFFVGSLIAEHQRIGQIITAELPFRTVRSLVISLYLERHGEDDDFHTLKELMKRACHVEKERNRIAHSIWGAGENRDTLTRIKTTAKERQGLSFQYESVTTDMLREIATEIRQVANDVLSFQVSLMDKGKAINNPFQKLW